MTAKQIGNRIRERRKALHYTLQDVADRVQVARSTIQRYELGTIIQMKKPVLYSIAMALDVNPDWLTGESEKMELPATGDFVRISGGWATPEYLSNQAGISNAEYDLILAYRKISPSDRRIVDSIVSHYASGSSVSSSEPSSDALDIARAYDKADKVVKQDVRDLLSLDKKPVSYIRHYLTPAAAGYASPVQGEDYELLVRTADVPAGADFCINISGDSMEPYIKDGSLVYVQRDSEVEEFQPGVFFVDGDVFVKQWCVDMVDTLYLLSANPARQDANIIIPRDSGRNVVCFGKVLLKKKLPQPKYR